MADEFIKGLGFFVVFGLAWMITSGWYRTEGFESTKQLVAEPVEPANLFDSIGIFLNDVFFWAALVGALTFWVLIPMGRQATDAMRS